ncbi:MAG: hypothetical protein HYZ81_15550 [Nitrospinae bacterium]|nr:hypothetical protein [Nitrospinota bacterium]
MGSLALTAVLPIVPGTVDDAREIGALSVLPRATAMRIAPREPDGALVYVEETPIWAGWQPRMVEEGSKDRPRRWWRFEVQVSTKPAAAVRPGHQLVVALHPYSHDWVQHAPFKRALREARPDLRQHRFTSLEEVIRWIETQTYDFWETGNYLTAGISEPDLPFKSIEDIRNMHGKATWVFGLCDDFAACVKALLATEKANELVHKTENGTLRFWPPVVSWPPPAHLDPGLYDELRKEAWSLMWASSRQALAGPHEKSETWLGQQVANNVDRIYRNHLWRLYNQLRDRR